MDKYKKLLAELEIGYSRLVFPEYPTTAHSSFSLKTGDVSILVNATSWSFISRTIDGEQIRIPTISSSKLESEYGVRYLSPISIYDHNACSIFKFNKDISAFGFAKKDFSNSLTQLEFKVNLLGFIKESLLSTRINDILLYGHRGYEICQFYNPSESTLVGKLDSGRAYFDEKPLFDTFEFIMGKECEVFSAFFHSELANFQEADISKFDAKFNDDLTGKGFKLSDDFRISDVIQRPF